MRKSLLFIIALAGCGFAAQDITVSNDSLGDDKPSGRAAGRENRTI